MERSNSYPDKFNLEDYRFSSLTCDVGLEIDSYITRNKALLSQMENPSSKLAKILEDKITELEKLSSTSDLSFERDTFYCLISALYSYKDKHKGEYNPYKINDDFRSFLLPLSKITPEIILRDGKRTLKELRDVVVPIYLRISENLKSYKNLPGDRQKILRDFAVTLSEESGRYRGYFSTNPRRLAA